MNEKLQKAIDSLSVQDVYLRRIVAECAENLEPKYSDTLESARVEAMHLVRRFEVGRIEGEGDGADVLRVFVLLGVRWVDQEAQSDEPPVHARVEAEFIAEYLMKAPLEEDCINEFAQKNASYHVWPYWRELLMNHCARMHLPRLVLPAMQLAHNRHQARNASSKES